MSGSPPSPQSPRSGGKLGTVTVLLSVIAGFGIGYLTFRSRVVDLQLVSKSESAGADTPPFESEKIAPLHTEAKAKRLYASAQRKGDWLERENEIYLAIEALDAEDCQRILGDEEGLKSMIHSLQGINASSFLSGLVARWISLDRDAVVKWLPLALDSVAKEEQLGGMMREALAAKLPEEIMNLLSSRKDPAEMRTLVEVAMREWAMQDPVKAKAWLEQAADEKLRRTAETSFHLGVVANDPLRVFELIATTKDRDAAATMLSSAAQNAAKVGPGILRQLAGTAMEPWMVDSLVNVLADEDPEAALDLTLKHCGRPDGDQNRALSIAFASMAGIDREQCLAKLPQLSGRDLAAAVSAIGNSWSETDPAAALTWLMGRPAAERTGYHIRMSGSSDVAGMAFRNWIERAPDAAQAWLAALPPSETRNMLVSQGASTLASRRPAEAVQMLAQLGETADLEIVGFAASAWADSDAEAAANWAISQPPGRFQTRSLAAVVGTWGDIDDGAVETWLSKFPPGEARDASIQAFLWRNGAWMAGTKGRTAEFEHWFEQIDDPWIRTRVAASSYFLRKNSDPEAARAWFQSLPNLDPAQVRHTLRNYGN